MLLPGPQVSATQVCESTIEPRLREARAQRQPIQSRHPAYANANPDLFVDDLEHPYEATPGTDYCWIRGRQVGGRGVLWGGLTLRMSDHEFCAIGSDAATAWPIRHRDLAASYENVERFFGICGETDRVPALPDGAFEAPAPFTLAEEHFKRATESAWQNRRVVHCRGIRESAASADERWPRRSMQHRVLPEALASGRVQLQTDTIVRDLGYDPDTNRVTHARCIHRITKERTRISARLMILCASTIETLRILLASASERHPRGLANSSGLLGHYLLDHAAVWAVGPLRDDLNGPPPPFGGPHGFLIPRFQNLERAHERFERGYGIWGNAARVRWRDTQAGLWSLCAMLEVLPQFDNRVQLSPSVSDAWGIPAPSIHVSYGSNEMQMIEDAQARIEELAGSAGWPIGARGRMAPGSFVHELGGARMGCDPQRSVLTSLNQSWDIPNLFVLDGASFVSAGWQNPTLTLLALADRACAFIARELEAGHL